MSGLSSSQEGRYNTSRQLPVSGEVIPCSYGDIIELFRALGTSGADPGG